MVVHQPLLVHEQEAIQGSYSSWEMWQFRELRHASRYRLWWRDGSLYSLVPLVPSTALPLPALLKKLDLMCQFGQSILNKAFYRCDCVCSFCILPCAPSSFFLSTRPPPPGSNQVTPDSLSLSFPQTQFVLTLFLSFPIFAHCPPLDPIQLFSRAGTSHTTDSSHGFKWKVLYLDKTRMAFEETAVSITSKMGCMVLS